MSYSFSRVLCVSYTQAYRPRMFDSSNARQSGNSIQVGLRVDAKHVAIVDTIEIFNADVRADEVERYQCFQKWNGLHEGGCNRKSWFFSFCVACISWASQLLYGRHGFRVLKPSCSVRRSVRAFSKGYVTSVAHDINQHRQLPLSTGPGAVSTEWPAEFHHYIDA